MFLSAAAEHEYALLAEQVNIFTLKGAKTGWQ